MFESMLDNVRSRSIYLLVIIVGMVFIGRLFVIQIIQADHYKALALEEQLKKFEIPASRGIIYVRDGDTQVPLVLNQELKTVYADPRYVEDPEETARVVARTIGGEAEEYEELLSLEDRVYVVLKKKVSLDNADDLDELGLSGIGLQSSTHRVYPEGALASQVLGFVNDEGDGQYGVEGYLNESLSGQPGQLKAVTDVRGIPLTTDENSVEVAPDDGESYVLTIDRNVQKEVEEAVKRGVERTNGKSGNAIVIDPNSGKIVAMANYPTYDPAKFYEVEDQLLFNNAVVSEAYEPGSVIKPFAMSAGLQEGAVAPSTTYYDSGSVEVDDRTIQNADERVWGQQSMKDVIIKSINTGIVFVLKQLGGGTINDTARDILYNYYSNHFKFGTQIGVAQTSESAGLIIPPNEVQGNNVRYSNMAFGQGMSATVLQVASAFSALVNGGDYYQPYLIHSSIDDKSQQENVREPQVVGKNAVSEEVSRTIREMLIGVVESGGGYYAERSGYTIGGKTGTAQLLDPDGQYSTSRYTGSFVGFISGGGVEDTPDYVVMTRIVEPKVGIGAGAEAAAPVFGDIADFIISYYQIPPSGP
jgi:stage V sporulation protein D (sporulation-specific penicillin-binding protein)